jgi:hypothetical protein
MTLPQTRTVSGFHHFVTLPAGLVCRWLTAGDDGFVYACCDDALGGTVTLKISTGEDGKGHIEQMSRIEAQDA